MTISTTTIKDSYSGNGTTSAFTYTFKITDDDDIQVIIRSATGTETIKTKTTHYTVSGVDNAGGGTITFTIGNIPTAVQTIILRRATPQTQELDLIENDPLPANSIETAYDKLTSIAQELQEQITRSIKLSKTNTMTSTEFTVAAADRADKILAFDANGEISVTQELGTYQGNWATATSYAGRDLVKDTSTNNIFIVNTAHTSSGAQPLTTNANSAYYTLIVDAASATTSAAAAAASATAAAASATTATTQATNAATSASTATTQASNASTSATAAAASAASAAVLLDTFDDIYLGAYSSNPTLDNDGGALTAGDLYFNTVSSTLQVYSGSAWQTAAASTAGFATLTGAETLTNKTLTSPALTNATGSLTSPTITTPVIAQINDANGNEELKFTATASAVNEITITNSATGTRPDIAVTGGDTNIGLSVTTKGTGLILFNDAAYNAEGTLTDGATVAWDVGSSPVAKLTLGGNRTLSAPTNGATGQFISIAVIQDATGSRTLTWNSAYEFTGDTAPTLTTTVSKADLFVFRYNGSVWHEMGRNLNLSIT